jgi:hypothetical protein
VRYLLVFVLSVAVGLAVYVLSVRAAARRPAATGGFGAQERSGPPPAGPGYSYVPVTTSRTDWQSRLSGFIGLLISVALGAVALAFTIYLFGSMIARAISGSFGTGDTGST